MKGYPSLYGRFGITGSYLYYVPEYSAVVAGTFNNSEWGRRRHIVFILEILNYLQRAYTGMDLADR